MKNGKISMGSIVRLVAPGSRESNGEDRSIPAVVIGQYPDGMLDLYCLHFAGSALLQRGVRPDLIEIIMDPAEILRRLDEIENAITGKPSKEPKFLLADK